MGSPEPIAKRTADDVAILGEVQKMANMAKVLTERNVKELSLIALAQELGEIGGIDPADGGPNPEEAGRSPDEDQEDNEEDLHFANEIAEFTASYLPPGEDVASRVGIAAAVEEIISPTTCSQFPQLQ